MVSMFELHGSHILKTSRELIWPLIFDPKGLLELIPGCQEIEQVSGKPGEFRGVIRINVPGVAGIYSTAVNILRSDPPHYCFLEGEVQGKAGRIKGEAEFFIEEVNQHSQVTYNANGIITGALSKISPRFISSAVKTMITIALESCERKLTTSKTTSSLKD
jgi:carbon monoxide dehydrogenase subunit G